MFIDFFRVRRRGRRREIPISCLPCAPLPGIEPAIFWCTRWYSKQRSHLTRASFCSFWKPFSCWSFSLVSSHLLSCLGLLCICWLQLIGVLSFLLSFRYVYSGCHPHLGVLAVTQTYLHKIEWLSSCFLLLCFLLQCIMLSITWYPRQNSFSFTLPSSSSPIFNHQVLLILLYICPIYCV